MVMMICDVGVAQLGTTALR